MERLGVLLKAEDVPEATRAFSEWTFAYVGAVTDDVIRAYQREHERWVRSASALRSEDVRRLLDGRLDDEQAASSRLGYELRRAHCAIVCWSDCPPDGSSLPDLARVARRLAHAVGGGDVLTVTLGPDLVAAWTSPARTAEWEHETCPAALDAGVHVAIGEPHRGLEGFRRSYEEALEVRRIAMLTGRAPGRPRRYRDVALTALLTQDLDQAQAFAQDVLGELADDSDSARRLAATLRVFLDEHGSHARTARRLGVHENTVAYRLKKVAEKLGRGLDEARLETWTALVLHDVLRRAGRVP
jgi:DNA-binding PucR family transcriptional regulator